MIILIYTYAMGIQVNLAISLHQTDDRKRSALMPVNDRFPIADLLDACNYYIKRTNRRISFEWALIAGETDTADAAHSLGALLRGTVTLSLVHHMSAETMCI